MRGVVLLVQCVGWASSISVLTRNFGDCSVDKPGTKNGQATLFQEGWAYGNACGYTDPNNAHATGFFAAVGGTDWDEGYGCGTCALLSYKGTEIVVHVVDRCGGCATGWFDLGGPAWFALTNGALPGHIHNVKSRWIECPDKLLDGKNMQLYVKPGSHAWDTRFQPQFHKAPIQSLSIDAGEGWQLMSKCENFMFCKPGGIILDAPYTVRVTSANSNIDVQMTTIPGGQYVDTGDNNGNGKCGVGNPETGSHHVPQPGPATSPEISFEASPALPAPAQIPAPAAVVPDPAAAAPIPAPVPVLPVEPTQPQGPGNCESDGLFPDPTDCSGFIKCAQGTAYPMKCPNNLYFDAFVYNCNTPAATNCGGRPEPQGTSRVTTLINYLRDKIGSLVAGVYQYVNLQQYL